MNKKGIIFDFNGTLFWDSEYHEIAWDKFLEAHNIQLTPTQKRDYIHGRNNKDTLEILFQRKFSDAEVEEYSEQKEILYRNECLKHGMQLAPGAIRLFEELKKRQIPMAIATAAGKSNVDFFIEQFHLLDYFKAEHIIYNDGTIKGKPAPDIFQKAIDRLGVNASESIIFEDSFSGIQAAVNCNVDNVIIVNSNNEDYSEFSFTIITHFEEFDRKLLR